VASLATVSEDDVRRAQIAERRLRPEWPAERGDRRSEPLGLEAVPVPLALPDVDGAEAFVDRAGDMQDQSFGGGINQRRGDLLVVLPARGNVLHERVWHVFFLSARGSNLRATRSSVSRV